MRATEEQLEQWMAGGLDGDPAAYASLLRALVPLLHGFFRRRMGEGGGEIEDLVQQVLIAVHTRRMTYDRDRRLMAWLFAIARHKMIDHFRKSRHSVPVEGLEDILVAEGFEASSNAHIDVDRLLATLPPKQADAIRRTKLEGQSVAQAAQGSGLGEADVKVSVHRGLKALAARVRGEGR